jgi:predicted GIY-YIG superfamily endonuclease
VNEALIRKDGRRWTGPVQPHAVYRMYDGSGKLLYIGCTANISGRLLDHVGYRGGQMCQVARIELEWYPDFMAAREAEGRAIASENPPWNTDGTPRGQGRFKGLPRSSG